MVIMRTAFATALLQNKVPPAPARGIFYLVCFYLGCALKPLPGMCIRFARAKRFQGIHVVIVFF